MSKFIKKSSFSIYMHALKIVGNLKRRLITIAMLTLAIIAIFPVSGTLGNPNGDPALGLTIQ